MRLRRNALATKLLDRLSKGARLRVSLPFFSYEIKAADLLSREDIDARIARLDSVRRDLEDAVSAIEELQAEAASRRVEVTTLSRAVSDLQQDRTTAETLLTVPQESFSRVLSKAAGKGRLRGIIEGSIVGFLTGAASSFLIWKLTN